MSSTSKVSARIEEVIVFVSGAFQIETRFHRLESQIYRSHGNVILFPDVDSTSFLWPITDIIILNSPSFRKSFLNVFSCGFRKQNFDNE